MKIYVEIIAVCNKKNRFRLISEKSENVIVQMKICWFIGDICALKRHLLKSILWQHFNVFQTIKQLLFSSFFNKLSLQLFKIYGVICILYLIFIVTVKLFLKKSNYFNFIRPFFKVIQYFTSLSLLLGAVFPKQDIYPYYLQMLSRFCNVRVLFLLILY